MLSFREFCQCYADLAPPGARVEAGSDDDEAVAQAARPTQGDLWAATVPVRWQAESQPQPLGATAGLPTPAAAAAASAAEARLRGSKLLSAGTLRGSTAASARTVSTEYLQRTAPLGYRPGERPSPALVELRRLLQVAFARHDVQQSGMLHVAAVRGMFSELAVLVTRVAQGAGREEEVAALDEEAFLGWVTEVDRRQHAVVAYGELEHVLCALVLPAYARAHPGASRAGEAALVAERHGRRGTAGARRHDSERHVGRHSTLHALSDDEYTDAESARGGRRGDVLTPTRHALSPAARDSGRHRDRRWESPESKRAVESRLDQWGKRVATERRSGHSPERRRRGAAEEGAPAARHQRRLSPLDVSDVRGAQRHGLEDSVTRGRGW